MKTLPLVSIIIPVYNVEKYLRQCLNSVVGQDYENIEVILINDGSPDNSDEICSEFSTKYQCFRYFVNKNQGLSATRNFGIKVSTGEYLFFLDSDDYLAEDCISTLVKSAVTGKLVVTGYHLNYQRPDGILAPEQYSGEYDDLVSYLHDFYKYFATKFNFVWGKLYKRSIIVENNIVFMQGVSLVEDVLFNLNYYSFCQTGIILLHEKGYYYRQSDSSTLSKRFDRRMFDWNELAYCEIRDFLISHSVMTQQNRSHFYDNVLGNLIYSTGLLSLQVDICIKDKVDLIRKYTTTALAKETFIGTQPSSFRTIIMTFLMKNHFVYTYVFVNQLISSFKRILR